MNRSHPLLRIACFTALAAIAVLCSSRIAAEEAQAVSAEEDGAKRDGRPNLLLAIADDWGWPHAGAYSDPVVQTPAFDRLAREGALFRHAYVSSPSCTPSRGALLTGQYHWRLKAAGNLWSVFPDEFETYPERLEKAGYFTGVTGKGWGPGRTATAGRELAGPRFKSFDEFLSRRSEGKPFCFWLGSGDPHRPYEPGSGAKSGMDLGKIRPPACLPDSPAVRSDVADYYFEVQRFDRLVGAAVASLEKIGELDRTLIFVTGDNGIPFPRSKSNIYDSGTRVPLVARWPEKVRPGRVVDDFVSLADLAPTFLEAAGLEPLEGTTGRSLMKVLSSERSGWIDPQRDFVLVGKERHCQAQEAPDGGGYPCRGIRTRDFFYIRNFRPDRWPAGTPHPDKAHVPGAWYADCDNGPTKSYMIEQREKDETHRRLFDLAFAKRPAEELYDLRSDPDQLRSVAGQAEYAGIQRELSHRLEEQLRATGDPRVVGGGEMFDEQPYAGGAPKLPGWEAQKKK
ncbi:MAG: sulfatase [Planctomycetes bacterium]|nr:sulfatase [Planctomycetota bacterium]